MDSIKIWELIGRKLAGEAKTNELTAIDQWLKESEENALLYEQLKEQWLAYRENPPPSSSKEVFHRLIYRITEEENQSARKLPFFNLVQSWSRIAATVTVIAILSGLAYFIVNNKILTSGTGIVEQVNPKGVQTKIQLSDGSVVWLNADSKLVYPKTFEGNTREIHLTGEAFFEVARLPEKPFIIHLPQGPQVKVLGTSFNVKAFQEDDVVETSVITGKVAFIQTVEQKNTTVLIDPNHKATYSKSTGQIVKKQVDSHEDMAWTQGKLVFRATPLEEIARTLERTYGITVDFSHEDLKNCRLTATFQEKNIDDVARLLAIAQEIDYVLVDGHLTLQGEGCN